MAVNRQKEVHVEIPRMGHLRLLHHTAPHSMAYSVRSEKLQNESFPNFSNFRPEFCPEFCSEFSPNFSRTFRASFRGRRRPDKIHQKSPPFFNVKFPGKHEKKIFTKMFFWRAGRVKYSGLGAYLCFAIVGGGGCRDRLPAFPCRLPKPLRT